MDFILSLHHEDLLLLSQGRLMLKVQFIAAILLDWHCFDKENEPHQTSFGHVSAILESLIALVMKEYLLANLTDTYIRDLYCYLISSKGN